MSETPSDKDSGKGAGAPLPPMSQPGAAAAVPVGLPEVEGYDVVRWIGGGGMGAVYEAWQQQPRRRVALKVIQAGILSPVALRRFEQEVAILARLEHPAIARIYAAGAMQVDGRSLPYFAMEYVEGEPVTTYAQQRGLVVRDVMALMERVAEGVQHAHQKGVIHRDLKPANILVDESGMPRILDFGVARATESDVRLTQEREVGKLLGTLAYMAPEQAAGEMDAIDVRSDVYALGVILFELLRGERPYDVDGKTLLEAVRLIHDAPVPRLSEGRPALRGDPELIVGHCLAKDPEQRYASAASLADDLRRWRLVQPIAARPPALGYVLRRFAQRHKALVAAALAVLLALGGGLTLAGIGLMRARQAEAEAVRQREVARDNLRKALDTVDEFMGFMGTDGPLAALPAAEPVRERLLQSGLSFYEQFLAENEGDTLLREEQVYALGRLLDAPDLPADTEAAISQAQQRIDTLTGLLAEAPGDVKYQRDLARSYSQLAEQRLAAGDPDGALAAYDAAVERSQALALAVPEALDYRRDAARLLADRGDLLRRLGAWELAESDLRAALAGRRQLVEQFAGRFEVRRDLARSLEGLALYWADRGGADAGRARQAAMEAVRLLEEGRQRFPGEAGPVRDLAGAYRVLATVEQRSGAAEAALAALRAARDQWFALVDKLPYQGDDLAGLARAEAALAEALGAVGQVAEAEVAWTEARLIWAELVETYPTQPAYQRAWARQYLEQAKGLFARGRYGEANRASAEADRLYQALVAAYPSQVQYQLDLARCYEERRRIRLALNDRNGANHALSQAWRLYEQLAEAYPERSRYQREWARLMGEAGRERLAGGDAVGAVEVLARAAGVHDVLVARRPADEDLRRRRARGLIDLGRARLAAGETAMALEDLQAGEAAYAGLAVDEAEDGVVLREQARALDELGKAYGARAAYAEALAAFEAAQGVYARWADQGDEAQMERARHEEEWGKVLVASGAVDSGVARLEAALARFEQVRGAAADGRQAGLNYAYALGNAAQAVEGARPELARRWYAAAEDEWGALQARYPGDATVARGAAWAADRAGGAVRMDVGGQAVAEPVLLPDADVAARLQAEGVMHANNTEGLLKKVGGFERVEGTVDSVAAEVGRSRLTFINFNTQRNGFLGVIHRNNSEAFTREFGEGLHRLVGRVIRLQGDLSAYEDRPQIVLGRPDQIRVMPAEGATGEALAGGLDEPGEVPLIPVDDTTRLLDHAGRTVRISGEIALVEGRGAMMFVNFRDVPQRAFAGLIAYQDWRRFEEAWGEDLAAAWQGRQVVLTGPIHIHRGGPQMRLTRVDQVELLAAE
jgi:hypothetical protein